MKLPAIETDRQLVHAAERLQKRINNDRRLLAMMRKRTSDIAFLITLDTHLAQAQTMLRNFTGKDVK